MANCPLCGHEIPERHCERCKKVISQDLRQRYCKECSEVMVGVHKRIWWKKRGNAWRKARKESK